jgi:hypothetical protein
MEEVWKDIGIKKYAVSNMGNVRGADGIRLLSYNIIKDGYRFVTIYNDAIRKGRTIHSLVMEAFVGERPNGYEIDHINRIRDDNRLENLRYCSKSENMLNRCDTRTDIEETDAVLRKKIRDKKNRDNNKERAKKYRQINRDKNIEYQRNYRQKQKEKKL